MVPVLLFKQFQVMQFIICTQLNGFKYFYLTQIILFNLDVSLSGTTTLSLNEPGSNVNEGVLNISQSSRTRASQSDAV